VLSLGLSFISSGFLLQPSLSDLKLSLAPFGKFENSGVLKAFLQSYILQV
jgi:hypothetical protein